MLQKKNKNKIGILGGTFDPPHIGHLHISKVAIKKLKLNKVIWLITKQNPLKSKAYLSTKKRIKLSREMISGQKKIELRYIDKITKSSKTYDALNYLKKNNKNLKLFFLIGADNLINFHKWRNWIRIAEISTIVVFPREKYFVKAISINPTAKNLNNLGALNQGNTRPTLLCVIEWALNYLYIFILTSGVKKKVANNSLIKWNIS